MKSFPALLLACSCMLASICHAQVVRNYGLIFSNNLKGGHTMIGNTSVAAYGIYDDSLRYTQSSTLNLAAMNDFNNYKGRDTVFPGGATSWHANDYYNMRNVDIDANLAATTLIAYGAQWAYHNQASVPSGWPNTNTLANSPAKAALGYNTTGLVTNISDLTTHYFVRDVTVTEISQYKDFSFNVAFDDAFIV